MAVTFGHWSDDGTLCMWPASSLISGHGDDLHHVGLCVVQHEATPTLRKPGIDIRPSQSHTCSLSRHRKFRLSGRLNRIMTFARFATQ